MISDYNLRCLGICAFRYALGRMSTIPSTVKVILINQAHIFNKNDWERFIEEIEDAIQRKNIGMEYDKKNWLEFRKFCIDQIIKNANAVDSVQKEKKE